MPPRQPRSPPRHAPDARRAAEAPFELPRPFAESTGWGVPRDRIRVIPRRAFTDELIAKLHQFSNPLLPEDAAHFRVHANTNEVVHIFEHGDAIVGYQFWRTAPLDLSAARVIL